MANEVRWRDRIKHVQIQTVSWCNRSCDFCPSQKFELPRTEMAEVVFHRALFKLKKEDYRGRLSLYLMNEPFLDRRLVDWTAWARKDLPHCSQMLSTNGDAMTSDLLVKLFRAGLNVLLVNVYDNDQGRYDHYRGIIKAAQNELEKLRLTEKSGGRVFPVMTQVAPWEQYISLFDATHLAPNHPMQGITNRAGNVPLAQLPSKPLQAPCSRPREQMYVRYTGDIVLCCNDWKGEVVLGNILSDDLDDVYNSEKARDYRRNLKKGHRYMKLCSRCDYVP